MKKILILGAGLVAGPTVRYLLEKAELEVWVADQAMAKAKALVAGHPRGTALELDVGDKGRLSRRIAGADIVISLLPWTLHAGIAALCLEHGKHLVTASYVKEEMQALDREAQEKGLLFLNEVGVDPGLDHMSAMRVIDAVKREGGRIITFYSYCGGLPALEANNNPLGYKFSWSPEGAMLAATNDGRYLDEGHIVEVPGSDLFDHYWLKSIPGAGVFEAYVNRDALPYMEKYGLEGLKGMYRGTLRNVGYCETWSFFRKLGLLNRKMKFDFNEVSPREVLANIVNCSTGNIRSAVAAYLKIPKYSLTLKKLEWLGLFSERKLDLGTVSVFEMLAHTLRKKLAYDEGEQDLLIQHHEFEASFPGRPLERIQSTLIDTGIPGGDTSMARTVGYPVGICARLIAEGRTTLTGVRIPVLPEIYEPVLGELETMGICFVERRPGYTEERNYWGDGCYEDDPDSC
jgi:saccharopine dehydrogenase-like NADP-dependent oxidoreductase